MISTRLKRIYDHVTPDQPLWDIGCDHGYLGLHAFRNGLSEEVHLVDRSPNACRNVCARIQRWFPERRPEGLCVWHRDAARNSLPIANGTVVLAGIGYRTILGIVINLFAPRSHDGLRLVLCAALKEEHLRLALYRQGWRLQAEELYMENNHVRQLLVCGTEGEILNPFWNGSDGSVENGLLGRYVEERRLYFSACKNPKGDLRFLKEQFAPRFRSNSCNLDPIY